MCLRFGFVNGEGFFFGMYVMITAMLWSFAVGVGVVGLNACRTVYELNARYTLSFIYSSIHPSTLHFHIRKQTLTTSSWRNAYPLPNATTSHQPSSPPDHTGLTSHTAHRAEPRLSR
jgi:hypothetical protein